MAKLTFDEIKLIVKTPAPDWVTVARKEEKRLNVHVNGIGTADYLNHIEGYENKRQYELRRKIATSNKFVFENLLRPVDKVFSANGGSVVVKTKTEQSKETLISRLQNFHGGYSLRKWIENIQAGKYYSSPAGLIFFEWNGNETAPTFKSIHTIRNYTTTGRKIEWVLFEPYKKKSETGVEMPGEYFRFVDGEKDYLLHKVEEQVTIVEDETFVNPWGSVPAITNSNIVDSTLSYHVSPIETVTDLADHYLRTTSVKNIYEFLHGYPIFWAMVEPCRRCDGTGLYEGETCTKCDGEGHTFKKDVSDVLKIRPPRTADDPKLAPDIAGFIQPDLATWEQQRKELDWLWALMHFTMWGTTQQRAENETATAAFIDVQPVNDRLNKFADAFEQTEKLITDIVAQFYIRDNYEGASVNYGRRFLIEPPDAIWTKYEKAKTDGAPKSTLDYLLSQYYQSEFKDDIESMAVAQKGMLIEPFIHKTDEQVGTMQIAENDKKRKFYFPEWWKSLPTEKILTTEIDKLKSEFELYIKSIETEKIIENERREVSGV